VKILAGLRKSGKDTLLEDSFPGKRLSASMSPDRDARGHENDNLSTSLR
jgi:hypothetical protein